MATVIPIAWITLVDIVLYLALPNQRFFVPDTSPFMHTVGNATIPISISEHPWLGNYPNFLSGYPFIVNFPLFKVVKLLRLGVLLRSVVSTKERHIIGQLIVMFTTVFSMITVFSSLLVIIENEIYHRAYPQHSPLSFDQAAYIIFLTIATIGNAQDYPTTWFGKFVLCVFFAVGFVVLVNQSKQLFTILQSKGRELFQKAGIHYFDNHIIVAGHASHIEILEFIKEFLSESHGKCSVNRIVIVLQSKVDLKHMRQLVSHRFFNERISVVEGDINEFQMLESITAESAEAVFLLTDTRSPNPIHQDARSLMSVLAIKNYSSNIPVYSQFLLEQNQKSFETAGCTVTLCVESLKTNLLSNNIMSPGISTLISNVLVSSSAEEVISKFHKKDDQEKDMEKNRWTLEYCSGCENELYCVFFSSHFTGLQFTSAAQFIYDKFDVFLIGIYSETQGALLSPGRVEKPYHICAADKAIVMARSIFHAHAISICEITKFQLKSLLKRAPQVDALTAVSPFELEKPDLVIESDRSQEDSLTPRSSFRNTPTMKPKRKKSFKKRKYSFVSEIDASMPLEMLRNLNQKKRLLEMNLMILDEARKDTEVLLFSANHLSDHIIIMGDVHTGVGVVKYLRSEYLSGERMRPVLLISKNVENEFDKLKDILCWFEEVYVMSLDPTSQGDLEKGGIQNAHAALYLTDPRSSRLEEDIVDMDAIQILLTIQNVVPALPSTAEIVFRRNIKYFKKLVNSGARKRKNQRKRVFDLFRLSSVDGEFEQYCLTSEQFASGKVFSRSFFTRLLCHSFFTKEIIEIVAGFNGYQAVPRSAVSNQISEESGVHQVSLPNSLIDGDFESGFHFYLQKRSILIGIYRLNPHYNFRYVMCNPSKETQFQEADLLFVVGNYETIASGAEPDVPLPSPDKKMRRKSNASSIDIVIHGGPSEFRTRTPGTPSSVKSDTSAHSSFRLSRDATGSTKSQRRRHSSRSMKSQTGTTTSELSDTDSQAEEA
eukprot:CAMPEP_0117434932 /NCGR_PEP_ID=MMETSP0759-20121206/210_1 /TAXON_ID=63605 /ORGANISM="Percolomonas cosmopolitus, Strain WS" /LENGTH=997 /DNA_ID=CAMNT_0005226443 /DNA_START=637 /DNA_END=3630 /DNA_ORIENTATION=+